MAMLIAIALTIFIVESQLPPLVPVPGIKLGLANIVTLFVLIALGKREAFTVMVLRVILGSIFTGNMMSCMYSLAGGVLCFLFMSLGMRMFSEDNMVWCISVSGAIGHNIGQIVMAVIMTKTPQVVWYLPLLLISAVITGVFTGLVTQYVLGHKAIKKMIDRVKK